MDQRKSEHVAFRATLTFKLLLQQQARQHGRSVTNYVEWLVRRDAACSQKKDPVP